MYLYLTSIFPIVLINSFGVCHGRGSRIDIFNQQGGDITQIRAQSHRKGKVDVLYNVLPQNSALKWSQNKDGSGNYVIPYTITGLYDSQESSIIDSAMKMLEENTCIRFKKRQNEPDFLDIRNQKNEGCYTNVGRMSGLNVVMLEANQFATCIETDIVVHELMHTIGLWHEHMRYDRDGFIRVLYDNIEPMYASQFEKISPDDSSTYNVPYDYRSIMHYGATAFAKRGRISMETKERAYQDIIGSAKQPSASDYKKICLLYGCNQCMGKPTNDNNPFPQPQSSPAPVLPPITPPAPVDLPDIRNDTKKAKTCVDVFPSFCQTLQRRSVLACSLLGDDYCCASCASLNKETQKPAEKPASGFLDKVWSFFG